MNNEKHLVSNFSSNEEIYLKIGYKVARNLFEIMSEDLVIINSLSTNYYSFTFSMDIKVSNEHKHVFVKIPKVDMRGISPRILPISAEDRVMAIHEESSLKFLEKNWNNDESEVSWVKLLGTIPEYNAIITERIFANEALTTYRYWDLYRRFGFFNGNQKLQQSISKIGLALGKFHNKSEVKESVYLSELLPKIGFYCGQVSANSKSVWPNYIWKELQSLKDEKFNCFKVTTLKGIDIRNVLIDSKGMLYMLDPGKLKISYAEADVARFIMTYRILFWGSIILPIFKEPSSKAEQSFVSAYQLNTSYSDPQLLNLFLLKEQLKHWYIALDSLQRLPWPSIIKSIIKFFYVDLFYVRQVSVQLDVIKKGVKDGL